MTFKALSFSIAILVLEVYAPANAGCVVQVTGNIGNEFTSAIMCSNTLTQPSYQISFYEESSLMFSMFSFDKLNAGYMCISRGDVEGDNLQCRKTGIRAVPKEFKSGGSKILTFNFKSEASLKDFYDLFEDKFTFSTSTNAEDAIDSQCFAGIREKEVYFGFNSTNIYPLSNCLFAFEEFLGRNPRITLRLREAM